VEKVHDVYLAQLMTYMRFLKKPVGVLLNFNVPVLKDGIYRRVL
jgi:GxxExxY protein